MRLAFCGTPQFAVPTLRAVLSAGHTVELVLSQPDRPSGRGLTLTPTPVKLAAAEYGLPVMQPETIRTNETLRERLTALAPDVILVVAYGRLIPPWMLELPRHGNLNLHASLLPKYRGAAPIQWAIAQGERETGVTTMRIDAGLDTGDMLLQQVMAIAPEATAVDLAPLLAAAGAELMVKTLVGLEAGTLTATPQNHAAATLAPILSREDGRVDWSRSAAEIYNRWRGFQPWPGAFSMLHEKKITLHGLRPAERTEVAAPGTLVREGQRLLAACGDAGWLEVTELQAEGKRRMTAAAFLNGAPLIGSERME